MRVIKRRRDLFDKKYKYKIYTNCKVSWSPHYEKWFDRNDREWINNINSLLRTKYIENRDYKIQGAVVYCRDLDVAYHVRMLCDEKIVKIEEAVQEIEE